MKLLLVLALLSCSSVFAAIDYQFENKAPAKINKALQESIQVTSIKIKATFGGGTGSIKVIRSRDSKQINVIEIAGRLSTSGPFNKSINYNDFKNGQPLNFVLSGYSEPRMIIEAHTATLNDFKGGKARIKYLTGSGYKSKEVSIWPNSRGELRLWDESGHSSKVVRTLVIKVNPFTMKVIDLLYQ